jgi:hypothetical protein
MDFKYFPKSPKYQNETPVWLRLAYHKYETYFANRSVGTRNISADPHTVYWLPLPSNVGTATKIQASDDASTLSTVRTGMMNPNESYVQDRAGALQQPNQPRRPVKPGGGNQKNQFLYTDEEYNVNRGGLAVTKHQAYGVGIAGMFGRIGGNKQQVQSQGLLATTGNNSEGYVDIQDTAWFGQNKKQFDFLFNLKAKTIQDSSEASIICNDFSNLILPSIDPDSLNKDLAIYNQTVIHPGVWEIIAVSGNKDVTDIWLGKYPQPCLLMAVEATRIGNATQGSINGMLDVNESILYPIQYTLNLKFQEIEPSYIHKGAEGNISAYRRSRFVNDT